MTNPISSFPLIIPNNSIESYTNEPLNYANISTLRVCAGVSRALHDCLSNRLRTQTYAPSPLDGSRVSQLDSAFIRFLVSDFEAAVRTALSRRGREEGTEDLPLAQRRRLA